MEGNPAASASINNELKMLLEEGELCQEVGGWVGWFKLNFDDIGGAADFDANYVHDILSIEK